MTELEKVIAEELRRIDPQESGVETKAECLAEAVAQWLGTLSFDQFLDVIRHTFIQQHS